MDCLEKYVVSPAFLLFCKIIKHIVLQMKLETLDDIKDLITSDTETEKIEFKGTTGQLERGLETLCLS